MEMVSLHVEIESDCRPPLLTIYLYSIEPTKRRQFNSAKQRHRPALSAPGAAKLPMVAYYSENRQAAIYLTNAVDLLQKHRTLPNFIANRLFYGGFSPITVTGSIAGKAAATLRTPLKPSAKN